MSASKAKLALWATTETEDTKTCTYCGKIKSLLDFGVSASGRKLTNPRCRKCTNKLSRKRHLERNFHITLLQYDNMLVAQGGGCKICGKKKPGGSGRFHVDHCHKAGKIRGLLCNNCNPMLGHAKDDPEI